MDTAAELLSLYHDDWVRKCLSVASFTSLVYDHTLTLDKEVEFIWQARWTFTKAIFLLGRYGNLICQAIIQFVKLVGGKHTAEYCDLPVMFTTVYMMSSMELIHILVLLRAWAIWGCEKRVAVMLIGSHAIYFLLLAFDFIFTATSATTRTYKYANLPEICITVIPPHTWIISVMHAFQDTIVFAITMTSLRRHSRASKHLYPTSLLFLLVRDAVIFYIASIFVDTFNAVTWIVYGSRPQGVLCLTFALNILSIAGQRFVLNLRGFTVRTYGSRSLSAEVDRQLQLFTGTRLEWWGTSTDHSDNARVGHRRKTIRDVEGDALDHNPNRQSESSGAVEGIVTGEEIS